MGGDEALRKWHRLYAVVVALGIASLLLRQPMLIVAGLLVLVTLAVPEVWYRYGARGVRVWQELSATRVALGEEAELLLIVENRQRLPLPFCEIEDDCPETLPVRGLALAPSPQTERALLRDTVALWAYQRVRRHYRIVASARGAFRFGPMTVRLGDPFGLLPRELAARPSATLLVHPLIAPIERFGLPARAPFGEHASRRRVLEDPLRFSGVREYAPGDEPRRIHWKATARLGAPQSKLYEPSTRQTLAIFLDARTFPNVIGGYDPALLELAISAAASIVVWGIDRGYMVGAYSNGTLVAREEDGGESARAGAADGTLAQLVGVGAASGRAGGGHVERSEEGIAREVSRVVARMSLRVPPSAHADQAVRILDGMARLLPYYGHAMEQVIGSESQRLPQGASVVYVGAEKLVNVGLILALRRLRSQGHEVTLLLTRAGDEGYGEGPGLDLANLRVRYIGGREVWAELSGEVFGPAGARKATNRPDPSELATGSAATTESGTDVADGGMASHLKAAGRDEGGGHDEYDGEGDVGEVSHGEQREQRAPKRRSLLVE